MQICNSSLKKATDLKRKSFFFYTTDGVIQLGSLSKQSSVSSHYFFWLFFSSAYLKSLSKNEKKNHPRSINKIFRNTLPMPATTPAVLFTIKGIVSTKNSAELSLQITKILLEIFSSTGNFRSVLRERRARLLNYLY